LDNRRQTDGTGSVLLRIAKSGIETFKSLNYDGNHSVKHSKSTNAHIQVWSNTKMKNNGNFLQQRKWEKFGWIILRKMLLKY
jgi:hypothetical protein